MLPKKVITRVPALLMAVPYWSIGFRSTIIGMAFYEEKIVTKLSGTVVTRAQR
jgi:hypothetical protein